METDDLYDSGRFSVEARGGREPDQAKHAQSERSALRRFLRLRAHGVAEAPASVLEIGCGTGAFLNLLRGWGSDALGLEPDRVYSAVGSARYGIEIRPERLESATDLSQDFDLIAFFHVLEHTDSPVDFLRIVRPLLHPHGLVYLEIPTLDRPCGGDLEMFFWRPHLFSFSDRTARAVLKVAGLSVEASGFDVDHLWMLCRPAHPVPVEDLLPIQAPTEVLRDLEGWSRRHRARNGRFVERLRFDPVAELVSDARRVAGRTRRLARAARARLQPYDAVHFGQHCPENAGDRLLFYAVRRALETGANLSRWQLRELWPQVREQDVRWINRHARSVVVGGGGLLLRDTAPNPNSGWQWNISVDMVREIDLPLIVYAVGYNRFRDQPDFDPVFERHLRQVVHQSAFFGLRNRGSIDAVRSYLPEDLHQKVLWQPCPTTVARELFPASDPHRGRNERLLGLNAAFDRLELRFGSRVDEALIGIARAMRRLQDDGWSVQLILHDPLDGQIRPWLDRFGVRYGVIDLYAASPEVILRTYELIPLVVGMRGHAQMIPFGLGGAIVSLVTHDKLRWFLDDIGHPEWAVEMVDSDPEARIVAAVEEFDADRPHRFEELDQARAKLWRVTCENATRIRAVLGTV